jgi:uncharacterized membrane protein YwzB
MFYYIRTILLVLSIALFGSFLFVHTPPVLAQGNCDFYDPQDPLGADCARVQGLTDRDPRQIVGSIIQVALGLIGIILVVLILYAGFQWMTAAGNDDAIKSAKKTIAAAVVGLVVILMSYAITDFILEQLQLATTGRR